MDLFDEDISGAPAARARPSAKFVPKVKFKKPPQKKTSASEHATSPTTSKDSFGIYQNECHNAVAGHPPQVEQLQNMEADATNSKMGIPQEVSVNRDTAPLVGNLPFTSAASEDVADQPFANFPQSASKADFVGLEVGSATKSIPEIDFNNENELNNVAAPSTTIDRSKSFKVIDNSLRVSSNVGFKSASDKNNTATSESNIHDSFRF